jgi:hypothetical protein
VNEVKAEAPLNSITITACVRRGAMSISTRPARQTKGRGRFSVSIWRTPEGGAAGGAHAEVDSGHGDFGLHEGRPVGQALMPVEQVDYQSVFPSHRRHAHRRGGGDDQQRIANQ